eukprot:s2078_g6.t1
MADVGSSHRLPFEVHDGFGVDNVSRSTLGSTMRCSPSMRCSVPTLEDRIRNDSERKHEEASVCGQLRGAKRVFLPLD